MATDERAETRQGLLYVTLAVFFFSTSPVFIRWAQPLGSYEIAAWRLAIAAGALVIAMAARGERWAIPRQEWGRFVLFGLITGLHFLFYIASLAYTTIAHSLAIVYTAPIFVTLASAIFLHEPIPRRKWGGIALAVVGVAILAGFQPHFTARMLLGDVLALGSAIMFGFYSVAGRSQRHRYPLFTYAATVYGLAAVWAAVPAALTFTPTGYNVRTILSLLGMGLLPLAVGHTLYNAALRRTHATYVNIIATQEVTGGILLGILLLGEMPGPNEILGALVTLAGILLVVL